MIKLHLGCGPHIFPGWQNYDSAPAPGVILHDLRKPLPVPSGTAAFVFSEHFLEHLTQADGLAFLRECYRVLAPGGVLRLSVPNLAVLVADYARGAVIDLPGVWSPITPAQMLNEGMRLWGHEYLYDEEELQIALRVAGFGRESLEWCRHRESRRTELRDLEVRPFLKDLIVEAEK